MQLKLVIVRGEGEPKEVDLTLPAIIGRSREADVTIGHPLVSRRHCELTAGDDGIVHARDLGSLNGTFVGQQRVEESVLKPGALLTIGNVTFRAIYAASASIEAAGDEAIEFPDFEMVDEFESVDEEGVEEVDELADFEEVAEETIAFEETQPVPVQPAKPVPAKSAAAKSAAAKPAAKPAASNAPAAKPTASKPEKKPAAGKSEFDLSWLDEPGEDDADSSGGGDSNLGNFLKGLD